ncbi:hypothetical protein [Ochrovirga pacifica]|uniref:hypothetical protein n=1 Tax=Ochrovirga pacifica TaxID=1042376 RepID=UPI00025597DD|nr:hypothetical protein [Ochrovirga pacifica]
MNEQIFQQNLTYWYKKSKVALKYREDKDRELHKRKELYQYAEPNPDFNLSMVNVCGVYEVVGGNPDVKDSFYTGLLHIDLISNQIEAHWLIEGSQTQTGYGFVFNDTLVLHFNYWAEEELFNGIVAYQFVTPEIVIGKWTEEIALENAFEMCRKLSPNELGEAHPEDFFSAN